MNNPTDIERVLQSPDQDAIGGEATYCIGCGSCAYLDPAFHIIRNEDGCNQAALSDASAQRAGTSESCPFATAINEDILGNELFSHQDGIHHDAHLGYWLQTYVGYVASDGWRARGSSGGMVSWMAAKMLEEGIVDAVVHVKNGPDPAQMYTYQVSHTVEELKQGAKSKYYPIEMSHVLSYIREHEGRYLFIGIPCFVKAIRLLCRKDTVLAKRIRYCLGLVCGHLKSDFFAKSEAWESGVPLDDIKRVDFRYKTPNTPASDYAIEVERLDGEPPIVKRTGDLSTTNWGLGYFKYNACDYCDDVLAETADMTFGDAWLPQYVADAGGCNVIVIRNRELLDLLNQHRNELVLHDSNSEEVYQSQSAGFRHRRQGLAYRLYVHEQRGEWTPTKRVKASLDGISDRRQQVYAMRTVLKNQSFVAFRKAESANDFSLFVNWMKPFVKRYNKVDIPFKRRVKNFIKKFIHKYMINK
ncbi:Coenzyme F420 hydrogenase/dehydrogenase, beta subunit C-terminal domain [Bifidobacterium pseudolongum]|jgi:coenzyme F420 hydrogenase subunit beta|uniref:Coenzyme F420 hydrogenase/dehydrogenase, beta subunit C-terminal domain n=1 Tax=Bifidobacterium pseudolongum TaxID=1694 RepID=UPI0010D4FCC7|nr:Coenzyme F420 hydrogenase/dehydrogenase, beta subunit C-terminal domain [Bifidobacterium pseudolongum]RYQ71059.1 oxidoreductase [Bifidobacterium pseudolongum subsp. globosum]